MARKVRTALFTAAIPVAPIEPLVSTTSIVARRWSDLGWVVTG